MHEVN